MRSPKQGLATNVLTQSRSEARQNQVHRRCSHGYSAGRRTPLNADPSGRLAGHEMIRSGVLASLIVLLVGAFAAHDALALTCAPRGDHYFFDCSANGCKPLFRAAVQNTHEPCARRMISGWWQPVHWAAFGSWYRVSGCHRHFEIGVIPDGSIPVLLSQLEGRNAVSGVYEFAPAMRRYPGSAHNPETLWVNHDSALARLNRLNESPAVVRGRWEAQVARDVRDVRIRRFAVWAVLPSLAVLLVVSTRSIWAHVSRTSEHPRKGLAFAVGAQLLIFTVGFEALRAWSGLDLIGLLAPITLLLWVGESGAAVWFRTRRRRAA